LETTKLEKIKKFKNKKQKIKKERKERNPDCRYSEKTYSCKGTLCVRFQLLSN
jgi:hypothetical protein